MCCFRVRFPLKRSRFDPVPDVIAGSSGLPGPSGLEPISPPLIHSHLGSLPAPSPCPDPYEFSDEASVNPMSTTRLRHSQKSPRMPGDDSGEFDESVPSGEYPSLFFYNCFLSIHFIPVVLKLKVLTFLIKMQKGAESVHNYLTFKFFLTQHSYSCAGGNTLS